MKKLLIILFSFLLFIITSFFLLWLWVSKNSESNVNKIFKIESYEFSDILNSYYPKQYGSATYLWKDLIYTNAHVVLDDNSEPIWNYRVCKTTNFKSVPKCFSTGRLLYYDEKNDLAVLRISDPEVEPVNESATEPQIWDVVKVYWYPSNWWDTISYTEWKISWFSDWLYKIDANIDAWNSWGWVFDSIWNLIWIAVSVREWYTTMWYIIPLSKIDDFKDKKGVIKEYTRTVEKNFWKYVQTVKDVVWNTDFSNHEIEIKPFENYNFQTSFYTVDNNEKYYYLWLASQTDDTYITLNNVNFAWTKDMDIEMMYKVFSDRIDETIEQEELTKYKVYQKTVLWKNTVLTFRENKEWVIFAMYFESSKNNYQKITISSDSIKSEWFRQWLTMLIYSLNFKDIQDSSLDDEYMVLDSLTVPKYWDFYIMENYLWDSLIYWWEDIRIAQSTTEEFDMEEYENHTMSSYFMELFSYFQESVLMNYAWLKQTKSGEYYSYILWKYNESKWWKIFENKKKYIVDVVFVSKKNDEKFYDTILQFTFDKVESKKIIDEFLSKISTLSWKSPFDLWNMKVWENIIKTKEFNFIN